MRPPPVESMENIQHVSGMMNFKVLINYEINTPTEVNTWDGKAYSIFIFSHMKFLKIDSKNIFTSLLWMANYIRARKVKQGKILDVTEL